MTTSVSEFRQQYRREHIRGRYYGWLHLAFTSGVCLLAVIFSALQLEQVSALEWITIPVVFLYANGVEYLGHRYPMHHPVAGLGFLFRRHTRQHHRFFTHESMEYDSSDDFKAVLFPPFVVFFYLGGFGVPMWLVLHYLASDNVAWLALAAGMAYYLNYELLHFAYHCSPQSRVGRVPGIQLLRRLHLRHHDPKLMTRYNFNITYPVWDAVFGTLRRGE